MSIGLNGTKNLRKYLEVSKSRTMTTILELDKVTKIYPDGTKAVDNVSFKVSKNEFFSLLGPSGCGKTTILRMIAGFFDPTDGSIILEGERVNGIPPYKRRTSMVFQNYALFPHLTVYENIAFGLKIRKLSKEEVDKRVKAALELVHLPGYEKRYPRQLSGGEQQRVALARSIVVNPSVLLLDEPLSNLDARLRQEMRVELKRIHKEAGLTTIYVTHDQAEALSMSDRIAILNQGKIEDIGDPTEIYMRPKTKFIATFIGQVNMFDGEVLTIEPPEMKVLTEEGLEVIVHYSQASSQGSKVSITIRPEVVLISNRRDLGVKNSFEASVEQVSFLGPNLQYICSLKGHELVVRVPFVKGTMPFKVGDKVYVGWDPTECTVLS